MLNDGMAMLKRRWEVTLVAVPLLLAALLAPFLWPAAPVLPSPELVEQDERFHPGGSACKRELPPLGQRAAVPDLDLCLEKAEQHRLQTHELVQQARSARAAEAQAFLAYDMAMMVLVGTLGGLFTLIAASAAALYARHAAEAARASVRQAARTSTDELRPWVQIDVVPYSFRLDGSEALVRYAVRLKNLGKLPAKNVYTDARVFDFASDMDDMPPHFASAFVPDRKWAPRTILPQGEIELHGWVDREGAALTAIDCDGEAVVRPVLAIRAVYQWGEDGRGRTCQSFELVRDDPAAEQGSYISIAQAEATCRSVAVKQAWFDDIG